MLFQNAAWERAGPIFLSTDGYCSLRAKVPTTLVIHDLAFEHYPKDLNWLRRIYYLHYTPQFVKQARRIVTVSEFSKQDIIDKYGTNPSKIDVVFNGPKSDFRPLEVLEKQKTS